MSANRRLWNRGGLACLLAAGMAASSGAAYADGGVTFTNISPGAGITYERFGTPAREADQNSFLSAPLPLPIGFSVLAETPQKPRGAPGVALFDYDNDGDIDVYVTNGPGHANSLYQNQLAQTGSVTFIDRAAAAGVTATMKDSSGICFGDIDNDGDEDFYVTSIESPNVLFRNNGNGTFSDITAAAGVGGGNFNSSGCALADFNNDGFLDLLVGNTYDDWTHRRVVFLAGYFDVEPNQLFLRRPALSGIQFEDVSDTSGIRDLGPWANLNGASYTWAVAAVDIDQDGDTDIMWADTNGPPPAVSPQNDRGYNRLLLNDGNANFTDVTAQAHLDRIGSWMGLSFGDYNCDGHIDFFSTNLGAYVGGLLNSTRWFLADGNGGFTDPFRNSIVNGPPLPIRATTFGWGTSTIDYDNDADQDIIWYGDDDLLTAIAMDNPGSLIQNRNCDADFVYDTTVFTTDHRLREVNGVAVGDLNNDGWQDVATVAMFRIVTQPGRFLPFVGFITPPLDPVMDTLARFENTFRFVPPASAAYVPHVLPNGDLALEVNSGGNGNSSVRFKTLGSAGLTPGGRSNRDGIGAVLTFTPDGSETTILPLVGGGSHASQDSRILHFGLGTAPKGTVEVLWPGGVRNVLFDVAAGEQVTLPEIPCNFDAASWKNFGQFNSCVVKATNDLRKAGQINDLQRDRIRASATRAFNQ
jgi:enediyne biosynthesis protein E4